MKKFLYGFIEKLIPDSIIRNSEILSRYYLDNYGMKSYSQEGEDLVLQRIFGTKKTGFYVDVGALHPKRFSNTYLFYKRGWRGINIEPTPGSVDLFKLLRQKDINLELAIADSQKKLTFYMFNEPALNTFDKKLAEERTQINIYNIIAKKKIDAFPLSEILDKYLPDGQLIDFLSVDVEGSDLKVLKSNNWQKYTPEIILIEELKNNYEDIENSEIYQFLRSKGYSIIAKTMNTLFFRKDD